jgi:hypothetical protein
MALNKANLLKIKLRRESFDCTPYGAEGVVFIQELNAKEREMLEASVINAESGGVNMEGIRAKTLALSLCDDYGKKLCNFDEYEELNALPSALMIDMYAVAQRLSGLGSKEIEKLAKKSDPAA